jgi:hypothetical protein
LKYNVIFIKEYLIIIISVFFLSYLFSLYLEVQGSLLYPIITVIQTTQLSYIFIQALLLIGGAIIVALVILMMILKRKLILLRYLIVSLLSFSIFYIILFYVLPLTDIIFLNSIGFSFFIIILVSSFLVYGAFYSNNNFYHSVSLIITTCSVGALLGTVFNLLQISVILILFSIYDVFSVFFGPIGKISKELNQRGNYDESAKGIDPNIDLTLYGLFLKMGSIEIGIGDLVFYSVLVSNIAMQGLFYYLLVLVGLLIGFFLTIYMTRKYTVFPGLPIPILISLSLVWLFKYF